MDKEKTVIVSKSFLQTDVIGEWEDLIILQSRCSVNEVTSRHRQNEIWNSGIMNCLCLLALEKHSRFIWLIGLSPKRNTGFRFASFLF